MGEVREVRACTHTHTIQEVISAVQENKMREMEQSVMRLSGKSLLIR